MQRWRDITYTVRDGLRLYARHYPAVEATGRRPAVCLPGLTQTSQECEDLATVLADAGKLARDVYTIDYRGRGRSEPDADWRNYTPFFEMLDVLDFFAMMRLHDAALIGTSRGGIVAMIMAAAQPTAIGAVVLNDIGPTIEAAGWMRQMGRVGRLPIPKDWQEATRFVRELDKDDFPKLGEQLWARVARQRYFDKNGVPAASYDTRISKAFSLGSIASGVPSLWPQFRALSRVPLLVLRGELSDVLSARTLAEMEGVHPRMQSLTVPAQGHAPLLNDEQTTGAIVQFLADVDSPMHLRRPQVESGASQRQSTPLAARLMRAAGQ